MNLVLGALAFVLLILQVFCSPVPSNKEGRSDKEKVLYDQRQEGEWNVRADLKNFVILIIPKTSTPDEEPTPSANIFDFFRSHPKHHGKHVKSALKHAKLDDNEVGTETMHFIESKTAPYHVDISNSKNHLFNDEILATQSPPATLALKTNEENDKSTSEHQEKSKAALLRQLRSTSRLAKAFVLTVPEEDFVLTKMEDNKKVVKKDGLKKKLKKSNREEMKLLGADEQCGPEMYRDARGVCRLRKHSVTSNESTEKDE